VAVTLEVTVPPAVDRLYFWALQVSFVGPGGKTGAGHLGLQGNPRHPGSTAVNWGGYHAGGQMLDGTESTLTSSRPGKRPHNTLDFPWQPRRPYRLIVRPGSKPGWWAGEVVDHATGERTLVRELHGGGDRLGSPVVWSEVFADCDAPPAEVIWSDLLVQPDGLPHVRPEAVRTNYQSFQQGGCTNTDQVIGDGRVIQRTNSERTTPGGVVRRL
jgi:hypothetical protein